MSLHVKETGKSGGSTVIFLHGVGAAGWMWAHQTAALADFHCLTVDLPGHGKSNQVEWLSLAHTADSIATIIRSRGARGKAHVIGLSLGGYVALVLMQRHSELLDRVLISGVTVDPMPNRSLLRLQVLLMSLMKRRWFGKRQARSLGLSPQMQEAFVENLAAMSMQAYDRIMREVVDFHLPASLHESQIATLVVAGGRETDIIKRAVFKIASRLPQAQGAFAPNVDHGWNVEDPRLFNAMTRAWLTATELPAQMQPVHEESNAWRR